MSASDEEKRQDIAEILREAEYVESLIDAEKQLLNASILCERILKNHFFADAHDKSVGALIRMRRKRLGAAEYANACSAADLRNQIAHHTVRGRPSHEEMSAAAAAFLGLVRSHAAIVQQGLVSTHQEPESEQPTHQAPADEANPQSSVNEEAFARQKAESYVSDIAAAERPDLAVDDESLWLSASALAEHTFCRRAGLLTHEGRYSDPEAEYPSLGRMTWYEPERLEEAYAKACHRLFWMLTGLLVGVAVFALSPASASPLGVVAFIGALGGWVYRFVIDFCAWIALGKQRIEWKCASAREPEPWSTSPQDVDWWELLQAGFEVEKPVSSLKDYEWKLTGKPRRLLRKGDLVIPVHRVRKPSGPIERQHIVRVVAHCHLVTAERAAVSPYAVILFADSSRGITVPYTLSTNREMFYEAVRDTRITILESDNRVREPLTPMPRTPCRGCPHGRPRRKEDLVPTMHYEEKLEPKFLVDRSGRKWHSCCGDRFGYKAEHEHALRMKLLESDTL